jgi:2-(1,2-epoxy-1,2-dihydrophenyl)acetyl-CoA isomerase
MPEECVIFESNGPIATITLNRPEAMNSLNDNLVNHLTSILNSVRQNPAVKTVVITGNGKAFCAGGDLLHLNSLTDPIAARNFIMSAGQLVSLIMTMDKPVIAMVNGVAAGAGFNIALACDIVYCSQSARFAQSFAKVGLVPDCGGIYLLPRIVGTHKAKELMFTADLIDANTALASGLVNKVVPDNELKNETYQFAERLASSAPIALSMIKRAVNRSSQLDLDTTLELEADCQCICMQTEDHKEGVKAFREKRKPVFCGK